MRYSLKLFLISLLFLLGLFIPYQTGTGLAYVIGVIIGVLVTVQTLSAKQSGDIFKAVVYKFNWGNQEAIGEETPNFPIELAKSAGMAGALGVIIYLIFKLFLKYDILTDNEVNMIGSFCFGAVEGVFLACAVVAYKLEKKFQKIMLGTKNVTLEKDQKIIINTISLSEAELVACITFITGDIKNIPIDKVASNICEYNLGKFYKERFGLKDGYEAELILQGLRSLDKRGLIVEKEIKVGDLLACLIETVVAGKKMLDGTFYDKSTHITANYSKNESGQYTLNLVSKEARVVPRSFPKFNFKLVGITSVLIGLVSFGLYFGIFTPRGDTQSEILPTPSEVNLTALGDNKLAYVKNGDLFLADKNGVEQITSGRAVSNIKVSQDGKYLGWIEKRDFIVEDGITRSAGYAVSLVDLTTLKITYDGIGPLNFVSRDDIYKKEIIDFDFLNTNPVILVYTSDGIKELNFESKEEKVLLVNNYRNDDLPTDDSRYTSVNISPKLDRLSTSLSTWESCSTIFYNIKTGVKTNDFGNSCSGSWSGDGKLFWNYRTTGMNGGGLWQADTSTGKILKKVYDPNPNNKISILDFDIRGNNAIAIIEPYTENEENNLDYQGEALYQINDLNNFQLKLIKTMNSKARNIKLLSNQISWLDSSSLHLTDLDGQNDQVIVEGISEYVWVNGNQADIAQKIVLDRKDNDKYLTFNLPSTYRFKKGDGYLLGQIEDSTGHEIIRFSLQGGGERSPAGNLNIDDISFVLERGNALNGEVGCRSTYYPKVVASFAIDAESRGYNEFTIDTTYCKNDTKTSGVINSILQSIKFSPKAKDYLLTDHLLEGGVYTNNKYGFSFEYPSDYGSSNKSGFIFYFSDRTNDMLINGEILENISSYDSIKEWYMDRKHYTGWIELVKDYSITEITKNNVNIISDRYASAEGFLIIKNFLLLNTGEVLSLAVVVDPKVKDQIKIGEELNNSIINSFVIR